MATRTSRIKKDRCEKCRKAIDDLYGRGYYNGNKDENMYCLKCYSKIFNEEFYDNLPEHILEKLGVVDGG